MSAEGNGRSGLADELKDRLIREIMERRMRDAAAPTPAAASRDDYPEAWWHLAQHPGYRQLRIMLDGGAKLGVANPYFRAHEGTAGGTTRIASG